jgi:ParB family chromosome partitioning protein
MHGVVSPIISCVKETNLKRQPLGRGLEAILGSSSTAAKATPADEESANTARPPRGESFDGQPRMVDIERIAAGRGQPRRRFADEPLEELASSIRERGVIQPLVVTESVGGYELIAGERRLRAAARAGLEKVPVIVRKEVTENDLIELALIENVQREDLTPMEEAKAYQRLIDQHGYTQEEVASRVGKSRVAIANTIRLLALPTPVQQTLDEGLLTEGHARALLRLPTAAAQISSARAVVRRGLSVRDTEELIKRTLERDKASGAPSGPSRARDADTRALEERLTKSLGTKVRLRGSGSRGRIEIEFYSGDELARLLERLET